MRIHGLVHWLADVQQAFRTSAKGYQGLKSAAALSPTSGKPPDVPAES